MTLIYGLKLASGLHKCDMKILPYAHIRVATKKPFYILRKFSKPIEILLKRIHCQ